MSQPSASVCVFCGARPGDSPSYEAAGHALGEALAAQGWRLVYGAGDQGIMGAVAQGAQRGGGARLGVIPTHLIGKETQHEQDPNVIITENMHERKKVMFMNCDAIVVLPGGAGSLDEFFEVLTWRQLDLHEKPIYLLNIEGYWTPLTALLDNIIARGFADESLLGFISTLDTVEDLLAEMRATLSPS